MNETSTESLSIESSGLRAWDDWIALTKPRITSFIFLAGFVGALLASGSASDWAVALEIGLWVAFLGAGSSAFNQVLERDHDALMVRTRNRPLPAGRVTVAAAVVWATSLVVIGAAGLGLRFGLMPVMLGLATLCAYTLVYTPLKRHTMLNTLVGALPGAMPPLIGYAALAPEGSAIGGWGLVLFAIIFAWQFPHFMAIAWMYREDYARAGMRMLPAMEGCEGQAGTQAVCYSLVLLPVSLIPTIRGDAGALYGIGVFVLGALYIAASAAFAHRENRQRARRLLHVSLVYLPAVFVLALVDPTVQLFGS